jgi:hypothetical protein
VRDQQRADLPVSLFSLSLSLGEAEEKGGEAGETKQRDRETRDGEEASDLRELWKSMIG